MEHSPARVLKAQAAFHAPCRRAWVGLGRPPHPRCPPTQGWFECTKGEGGEIILDKAREVLKTEFPNAGVEYVIPTEYMKGIGQCVAAAAMPVISGL